MTNRIQNIRSMMFFCGIIIGIALFIVGLNMGFHTFDSALLSLCGFTGTFIAIIMQVQSDNRNSSNRS